MRIRSDCERLAFLFDPANPDALFIPTRKHGYFLATLSLLVLFWSVGYLQTQVSVLPSFTKLWNATDTPQMAIASFANGFTLFLIILYIFMGGRALYVAIQYGWRICRVLGDEEVPTDEEEILYGRYAMRKAVKHFLLSTLVLLVIVLLLTCGAYLLSLVGLLFTSPEERKFTAANATILCYDTPGQCWYATLGLLILGLGAVVLILTVGGLIISAESCYRCARKTKRAVKSGEEIPLMRATYDADRARV